MLRVATIALLAFASQVFAAVDVNDPVYSLFAVRTANQLHQIELAISEMNTKTVTQKGYNSLQISINDALAKGTATPKDVKAQIDDFLADSDKLDAGFAAFVAKEPVEDELKPSEVAPAASWNLLVYSAKAALTDAKLLSKYQKDLDTVASTGKASIEKETAIADVVKTTLDPFVKKVATADKVDLTTASATVLKDVKKQLDAGKTQLDGAAGGSTGSSTGKTSAGGSDDDDSAPGTTKPNNSAKDDADSLTKDDDADSAATGSEEADTVATKKPSETPAPSSASTITAVGVTVAAAVVASFAL
ncbi:hypothetical protein Poli38472_010867 [Pythium oligandrum]|uniref:Uncharacterized protein n=1 Tax=Pythium oligandrum TaxID=41045 RepID=A0A8K1CEZ4_PYTOL|nr:hypothetical protein Poli38472_010867 [Pythium oligandrum]|eukprot:TMW61804.1 hypothetical protein Poli38472_010867 [Pythium oligandrum]